MDSTAIHRLHDGLLITGRTRLKIQEAEWTVLVTLDRPQLKTPIKEYFDKIMAEIQNPKYINKIPHREKKIWTKRLQAKMELIAAVNDRAQPGKSNRVTRGLANFVGNIAHGLFGLATDQGLDEIKGVVEMTRREQKVIVHRVNDLVTVLNHTYDKIDDQSRKINAIALHLGEVNVQYSSIKNTTDILRLNLRILYIMRHLDRAVTAFEELVNNHLRAVDKFNRQKASLELGRLTEELLPPDQLRDILNKASTPTSLPVEPIQWYYEHSVVRPIWLHPVALLIYRVKLPLVREIDYWRYNIHSWPQPYNRSGLAIQLFVEHKDVGLNPQTGEIFHPKTCTGWKPMVCRTGPTYKPGAWSCARAILQGNKELRHTCQVDISHTTNLTRADEIALGEYILITWGETIYTRCVSTPAKAKHVPQGTYLITVRDKCSISGKEWTLPGLVKRVGRVSVKALRVTDIPPLDIQNVIPEGDALKELKKVKFEMLKPVSRVHLSPLVEPDLEIDWKHHGSYLSYGLLITLVLLACIIGVILVVVYKRWPELRTRINKIRDEKKTEHKRDNITLPFSFFRTIKQLHKVDSETGELNKKDELSKSKTDQAGAAAPEPEIY